MKANIARQERNFSVSAIRVVSEIASSLQTVFNIISPNWLINNDKDLLFKVLFTVI